MLDSDASGVLPFRKPNGSTGKDDSIGECADRSRRPATICRIITIRLETGIDFSGYVRFSEQNLKISYGSM